MQKLFARAAENISAVSGMRVQPQHRLELRHVRRHYGFERDGLLIQGTKQPITFVQLEQALEEKDLSHIYLLKTALPVEKELPEALPEIAVEPEEAIEEIVEEKPKPSRRKRNTKESGE